MVDITKLAQDRIGASAAAQAAAARFAAHMLAGPPHVEIPRDPVTPSTHT